MSEKNKPSLKNIDILFLSVFGSGFFPWAPGTFGTLVTMPFLFALGTLGAPFFLYIPFLVISTAGACFVTDFTQRKYKLHDPSWIVIDESLGVATTWLFLQNHSVLHYTIIFALFRFFDIVKIWPASYFDKKVHHGAGTILDDIISGLFAGFVYLIINALGVI
ncbi:phosphatidylglycerophosphatase A [Halobacteriovorax marinus]|uniref:Phosphatidylglycerophosphatase A n=1 Tax=Halobacteriovorax marinus (strain ATCC BAA-682 / DSM 15412 / SJ) TaxID=862908 RepID=E1X2P8_HALMS|nr:phosphatidylglycerophosphatase A [Halobacteriovorax marinus]ATH06527.1 phosphatidylglycerophosphatase A [Halobacteriovorax marinus]CBW25093.1 phosphatidylglycerophosphatase A [Halobacteriovorax marinus SJ]